MPLTRAIARSPARTPRAPCPGMPWRCLKRARWRPGRHLPTATLDDEYFQFVESQTTIWNRLDSKARPSGMPNGPTGEIDRRLFLQYLAASGLAAPVVVRAAGIGLANAGGGADGNATSG